VGNFLSLLAITTLASAYISLLVAVHRSTRGQSAPSLLVILACLMALANYGIPLGSQVIYAMESHDRLLRMGQWDVGLGYSQQIGRTSLIDAGIWSFLLLAIVLTRPAPEKAASPP
jgi:hypothetical protein